MESRERLNGMAGARRQPMVMEWDNGERGKRRQHIRAEYVNGEIIIGRFNYCALITGYHSKYLYNREFINNCYDNNGRKHIPVVKSGVVEIDVGYTTRLYIHFIDGDVVWYQFGTANEVCNEVYERAKQKINREKQNETMIYTEDKTGPRGGLARVGELIEIDGKLHRIESVKYDGYDEERGYNWRARIRPLTESEIKSVEIMEECVEKSKEIKEKATEYKHYITSKGAMVKTITDAPRSNNEEYEKYKVKGIVFEYDRGKLYVYRGPWLDDDRYAGLYYIDINDDKFQEILEFVEKYNERRQK